MELYLIKSSIALSILYAFYWMFLKNETLFGWNRVFLITSLLVSLFFPLLSIVSFQSIQNSIGNILNPIVINSIGYSGSVIQKESISIFTIIYISGVVFFSLRFLSRLTQIYFLYQRFPKVDFNEFKAVILDGDYSPFTFFSILFIARSDYEDGKLTEMIVHEKAHRDQYHSIDILLLELITIVQWFNPFVWLFRIAIKSEHEFIADDKVMKEGFDKVNYQKLLFEKSLGVSTLALTSNFNYSLLKNRLKMMTIKKSGTFAKVKYFASLPLILTICLFITTNFASYAQDKVYLVVEKMPVYSGGDKALQEYIVQNMKYPKIAAENGVQAKVYVSFVVTEKGAVKDPKVIKTILKEKDKDGKMVDVEYKENVDPKKDESVKAMQEESVRVISLLGEFKPGMDKNKVVNVQVTMPLTFVLQ